MLRKVDIGLTTNVGCIRLGRDAYPETAGKQHEKLTTVRRDVQDMMKLLNDWSEQINVAKQALDNTENKLKDADETCAGIMLAMLFQQLMRQIMVTMHCVCLKLQTLSEVKC